jgi:hypothetical protein
MPLETQAREALAVVEKALAEKPHKEGYTFSAAAQCLCAVRDSLSARDKDDPLRRRWLGHINAVISVVLAGHFPLGSVPWEEIAKARDWLREFVAESRSSAGLETVTRC